MQVVGSVDKGTQCTNHSFVHRLSRRGYERESARCICGGEVPTVIYIKVMRKNTRLQSDSTRSCIDFDLPPQTSCLKLGIGRGYKLNSLVEVSGDLELYFLICQGQNEWTTRVAAPNVWQWDQVFELDVGQPVHISLFDKDEYGADAFLAGFTVPPSLYASGQWEGFKVSLAPDSFPELGPQDLCRPCYLGPSISIQTKIESKVPLEYSVEVQRHVNVLNSKQPYTLYEVVVHRTDGYSWIVALQFDEVAALRNQLCRVLPELASIPFPGKARFAWARRLWSRCSEFDAQRIHTRKYFIELMLNLVLSRYDTFNCPALDSMLEMDQFF